MGTVACMTEFEPSEARGWDVEAEQEALRAFVERFVEAWNRHDARGLAAAFLPTGDLLNTRGQHAMGREAVERLLTEEFSSSMKDSRATMELTHLRFLTPGIVHADADQVVEGVRKPDGTSLPPVRMHVSFSARKDAQGRWGYLSVRPYALLARF